MTEPLVKGPDKKTLKMIRRVADQIGTEITKDQMILLISALVAIYRKQDEWISMVLLVSAILDQMEGEPPTIN
jgi:hypothetical protein